MLALQQAGVPFDVVPGVSSAIAAPELAGIPVTHRGVSSAFLVVSGHDDETFRLSVWSLDPNGVTLVVLMGLGRSAAIASTLVERGWSPETPAAIVVDASMADQQLWRGTLAQLADGETDLGGSGPGTIVFGSVAAMGVQRAEHQRKFAAGVGPRRQ